jgi:hypothetical protein
VSSAIRLLWVHAGGGIQPSHREFPARVHLSRGVTAQAGDRTETAQLKYGLTQRTAALKRTPIDESPGHSASKARL